MSTVQIPPCEWQPEPHHFPALFDSLTPVVEPDGTIAIYGEDVLGRTDQPLARYDIGTFGMLADYCALLIKRAG